MGLFSPSAIAWHSSAEVTEAGAEKYNGGGGSSGLGISRESPSLIGEPSSKEVGPAGTVCGMAMVPSPLWETNTPISVTIAIKACQMEQCVILVNKR